MQSRTIREIFLDYFQTKEHLIMPSFSLVPQNDPTLLLIGAGMAPLKPFFTGEKKPPHRRIATCQKCVRTPDIDRVGHTGRHATFFEMLGNFSFGDYFKEEAITWAWDLVLNGYRLPVDRLWVSVYQEDEESYKIWNNNLGIPAERITRLGKEDNFWEIGPGPCGPCSEIYYDLGPAVGCGSADCAVGCDCDRFLEIWNLVFTQYNREVSGELVELRDKNIDTGAGLERMAMALQGVSSLYDTDLVKPLYDYFQELADADQPNQTVPLRIITEHSRGTAFMIADGILPANEGRGYVLRRLIRRALRYGRLLGIKKQFMSDAVSVVVNTMGADYPELKERHEYICQIADLEEQRFQTTLSQGMDILEGYIEEMKQSDQVLPGNLAFKLYDTYGFPLDLTAEILSEQGFEVDRESFDQHLKEQQERARAASRSADSINTEDRYRPAEQYSTQFSGYENLEQEVRLLLILADGTVCSEANAGEAVELLLDSTPFYAEAGGQVGDSGMVYGTNGRVRVDNTVFTPGGQIVHQGVVLDGSLTADEQVRAAVNSSRRQGICRSHTSTHLLHRVLKQVIGDHVNQSGSLVGPDRLRFDFNHFNALSADQLKSIEEEVNRMILNNAPVEIAVTSLENARQAGATAIFAEKYSENQVRMVSAGTFTRELCGGTHVKSTGEIGLFRILSEEGIGSGLRRIEAISGLNAYHRTVEQEELLAQIAASFNVNTDSLNQKISEHLAEYKNLQKRFQELQQQLIVYESKELLQAVQEVEGIKLLSSAVSADNPELMRTIIDVIKASVSSIVIVLGAIIEGRVLLVGSVTEDLVNKGLRADRIIKEVASQVGGGGGGKAEMAQAGGRDVEALPAALDSVAGLIRKQLKSTGLAK